MGHGNAGLFSTFLSRKDYNRMAGQLTDSMTAGMQNPEDIPDQFMDAIVLDDEDEPTVPLKKRGRKPKTESTSKQKDEWTAADFESFRVQKPEELKPAPEKTNPNIPASQQSQPEPRKPVTIPVNQTTDMVKNDLANLISGRKKVEVDLSKIVVGARVRHKAFGEGVIKEIETGKPYIHVLFDTGIEKPFVIPMAFAEGFLTLLEND